jgi:hypothetical protein
VTPALESRGREAGVCFTAPELMAALDHELEKLLRPEGS